MDSFRYSSEDLIKILINDAPCHRSNLTECEIEQLRENSCGISGCTKGGSIEICSTPPENIFLTSLENNSYICCGLSIALLVIVLVLSVIIIIVVAICVYFQLKKRKENNEGDKVPQKSNEKYI